jgi:hypothetical protein
LGLINAGDAYLKAVILEKTIGSNDDISTELSEEDRTFYLTKSDNLYKLVIDKDDQSNEYSLLTVTALYGRAAVAESNGDIDSAKTFYEKIISRISNQYPALADQARSRIDTLPPLANTINLPSDLDVSARNNQVLQRDSAPINSTVGSLTDITESDGSK